jgi:hypothetical protein
MKKQKKAKKPRKAKSKVKVTVTPLPGGMQAVTMESLDDETDLRDFVGCEDD